VFSILPNWKSLGVVLLLFLLLSPVPQAWSQRQRFENTAEASEVLEFWKSHKADVSMQVSGYLGTFGAALGLHYHPLWSVEFGFGGSGHFQAYGIRAKRTFMVSSALTPYLAGGVSRWHRTRGGSFDASEVSPGLLVDRLMSDRDRQAGRIDERLIHGSLGLQYIVSESRSSLTDFGAFAELVLLFDPIDRALAPTASFGASFYF